MTKIHRSNPVLQIDFSLLREQKLQLLKIIYYESSLSDKQNKAIEGIINLIDEIQDQSALEIGNEEVFGKE